MYIIYRINLFCNFLLKHSRATKSGSLLQCWRDFVCNYDASVSFCVRSHSATASNATFGLMWFLCLPIKRLVLELLGSPLMSHLKRECVTHTHTHTSTMRKCSFCGVALLDYVSLSGTVHFLRLLPRCRTHVLLCWCVYGCVVQIKGFLVFWKLGGIFSIPVELASAHVTLDLFIDTSWHSNAFEVAYLYICSILYFVWCIHTFMKIIDNIYGFLYSNSIYIRIFDLNLNQIH